MTFLHRYHFTKNFIFILPNRKSFEAKGKLEGGLNSFASSFLLSAEVNRLS
ncbi:hypothetical protein Fmac_017982 [Flemingia macrophylla]|uniref:Ribosomal protein L32 n=1 Tax=Flemingia macrophylla TaxID=520843 RepID=A0ABD1M3Q0_9FABA